MLLLTATTDKIEVTTGQAVTTDVHCSFIDLSNAVPPVVQGDTMGRKNTAFSTATTLDVSGSPASSEVRNIKTLHIRNKHASSSVDITVQFNQNATIYELHKVTLRAGEMLEYVDGVGFFVVGTAQVSTNKSTSAQGAGFASDTYLVGSNIPCVNPTVGWLYRLVFDVTKTGAGTATPIIIVRIGTAGTTSDTARLTFTWGVGTAVADTGIFIVEAMFRTVGSGTSAVLQGRAGLTNLASTGIASTVKGVVVTSSGFDSTVAGSVIGASYNGGTSASHTVQLVTAESKQY